MSKEIDMTSDFDLLDRFDDGDQDALEEIVSKYQKPIFFFILRMVWDETDAADLSQKTFVNAFRNIRSFDRRSNFKTWLFRIAINVCKNHFRDDPRRREVDIEGMVFVDQNNPLEHIISEEERRELSMALNELPEKQRHTITLKVYQGLKYREIAEITGCSEGTAKANFHFGVKKLREILKG
ncbi:MAG: sigma-70 family RNA polymerase sigma factor [Syntrophobacterales bacterium]|nr:MAG: sigma-70 family RNA polymerase sigma factor [Syntrophobacterales bacterium]